MKSTYGLSLLINTSFCSNSCSYYCNNIIIYDMMNMNLGLGKQKILILLASFIFLCVFFGGLLFSVYHLITSKTKSSSADNFGEYRILEVDSSGEITSRGIVSLPDDIFFENNEYVKYSTHDENHVLISKFGTEEFVCTGFCYCSEERRVVGSSNIVRKGVTTLIATLSSVLAYEKAKEYFSEECETKLSQTCSSSSIESEIDSCESIILPSASEEDDANTLYPLEAETFTETNEEESTQTTLSKTRVYYCEGECIPRKVGNWPNGDIAIETLEEMNNCKDMKLKKKFEMDGYSVHNLFSSEMTTFCRESSLISLDKHNSQTPLRSLCKVGKNRCVMKDGDSKIRKYWCKGKCANKVTRTEPFEKVSKGVDCGALEVEGEVTFSTEDMAGYYKKYNAGKFDETNARGLFKKETLTGFCKTQGARSCRYEQKEYRDGKPTGKTQTVWRNVQICSVKKKSVRCVQTFPIYRKNT